MDVSEFRVPSDVEEVFYIPEFVTVEEAAYLQRKIVDSSSFKWKTLPNRRLQVWGGELTCTNTLIPQELPDFITKYPNLIFRLRQTGLFSSSKHGQPNHVIVNEYHPGQGIMPHEDGSSYYPVVATLSLGSHAIFNYHQYIQEDTEYGGKEDHDAVKSPSDESVTERPTTGRPIDPKPILSLLLEPRSLVVTAKALYSHHLHAIEPLERDVLAPANPSALCSPGLVSGQESIDGIKVANWRMLKGATESHVAREGGALQRGTRLSITCRDVERVVGGKALGKAFSKFA